MLRRPPRSTRTDTLFPYTTLFRSLLNGFLSKEMFLSESLAMHSGTLTDQALPYLATLASAFAVLYSVRFIHQTFFGPAPRSEEHTSELRSLMRISYAVFCLQKKNTNTSP